ncbi:pSer/pThr/pTyr-binding forkhead associated (FHA) protein [Jatrophihabitans sp. GAS493]|uniref:FhaA domain-containing protein n=1 Tax=Jatrophihabitans sp. GAS493 TaxID=1907575 RepID=UPI000BC081EE|nr:FhaA domain-containing protein [Jatrophihabitans sp. GAS493]SOD70834.1 pSer/pThr/pTyr-binding forkhead associated (FHA) protein [Jatrophihabitans sp. GAS493]
MSLAQRFERRLESLVGTAFARVFKGQVEPVEIGTALQREATDKRNVMGNGEVLAPNRYRVTLSPSDYERLVPWQVQLCNSLAELVQEHLDENKWRTIGDIVVLLALDESLHTGVFGVASRMESSAPPRRRPVDSLSLPASTVDPAAEPIAPANIPPVGVPPVAVPPVGVPPVAVPPVAVPPVPVPPAPPLAPSFAQSPPVAPAAAAAPPRSRVSVLIDGTARRFDLQGGSNVVGRGNNTDLQLLDQGVSRRHIEIAFDGHVATLSDLGSTNGTTVNGHAVTSHQLRHGDVIRVGHTRLVFQQEQE